MNAKPWERNLARERKPSEQDSPKSSQLIDITSKASQNPENSDAVEAQVQSSAGTALQDDQSKTGASASSNPIASPNDKIQAKPRSDQVKNAVQFLLHPKVQSSSMDERRRFLTKKGLTAAEIEEAVRIAQPDIDRMNSPQLVDTAAAQPPATQISPTPQSPQTVTTPPPPPAPSTSLWQIFLAGAALLGLGTGLGLLVKKLGMPGAAADGTAAPAGHAMEVLLGKLDSMQASIDSNSRCEGEQLLLLPPSLPRPSQLWGGTQGETGGRTVGECEEGRKGVRVAKRETGKGNERGVRGLQRGREATENGKRLVPVQPLSRARAGWEGRGRKHVGRGFSK